MPRNLADTGASIYRAYGLKSPQTTQPKEQKPVVNVAINGATGRIGKAFFRQWAITELGAMPGIVRVNTGNLLKRAQKAPVRLNVVAMNVSKPMKDGDLVESLKHDSIFGDYPGYMGVEHKDGKRYLLVGDEENPRKIRVLGQREIKEKLGKDGKVETPALPWKEENVDIVVDTTGAMKTKAKLGQHLDAGAKKAIVSAPASADKDGSMMPMIVNGINDNTLKPSDDLISNASCTTTAAAAITDVINDKFGIEKGFIQSTHSATASQFAQDKAPPESKSKGSAKMRSLIDAIIPSTTGAAKAIGKVIPSLEGKLNGLAARVPTSDTSMVYLVYQTKKPTTKEEVVKELDKASKSEKYQDMLAPANKNATTKDMIGRHENAIYVKDQVQVIDDNMVVVPAFYDNEWGYTRSLMDLTRKAGKQLKDQEAKGSQMNVSA